MERLTRPTVEVDETAAKYMGKGLNMETMNDRLLELILNGPTLMAVPKDHLRHIIRQLYGALKAYEDIGLEPWEIEQTLMNFSSFLCEMTGGRMSKTNYTVQAMVSEANDHFERICDECRERAEIDGEKPLTLDELRQMDAPVWCVCEPIEGGNGYWCLCKNGIIITPAGSKYDVAEIPHWVFLRCKPEAVEE